jgi:hypothetical protein
MHHGGLSACTIDMGTPGNPICFHAGRMPLPSLVVALGIEIFGDHFLRVDLFKTLLLLLPLELAIVLVVCRLPVSRFRRLASVLLLLAPFAITAFLADVVNMQVEEGYSYSMLALAVALLLFPPRRGGVWSAIIFAVAVDGVYLAKSSMAPAAVVLLIGYLLRERRLAPRLVVFLLIIAAPLGWAFHQHHASGRYSFGTSIDGINLHKGNNAQFLSRYPPPPGETLDSFDSELNVGRQFGNEWSFNDFHQHAAFEYMQSHPGDTAVGDLRKLGVIFFSIRKYGSSESHGVHLLAEIGGMGVFRLIFWGAIGGAIYRMVRPLRLGENFETASPYFAAGLFLALVSACVLPYVLGFAYTRHVSILIYPAVLMCCRLLTDRASAEEF